MFMLFFCKDIKFNRCHNSFLFFAFHFLFKGDLNKPNELGVQMNIYRFFSVSFTLALILLTEKYFNSEKDLFFIWSIEIEAGAFFKFE